MTLQNSLPLFETRATGEGVIEGYGATFGGVDSFGDTIAAGAFSDSIKRGAPLMLWQHRQDSPIGRWTDLREDSRGLYVRGQLNLQTTAGREAYAHLREQDVSGLSIGFRIPPGGAESRGEVRLLKAIDLAEISVVSLPADPRARVTAVKAQRPETLRELQHALQELGYSRRQAAAIAQKGFAGIEDADAEDLHLQALADQLRAINFEKNTMSDLSTIQTAIQDLSTKAAKAAADNRDEIKALSDDFVKMQSQLQAIGQQQAGTLIGRPGPAKPSDLILKADAFKDFVERNARTAKATVSVPFASLLTKNTIVGDGANERVLAPNDRLMDVVIGPQRRTWLRSLIPTRPTNAANVEFTVETFVSNAGTQVNGASSDSQFEGAPKPESAATYALRTTQVMTIAHHLKMSKQLLSDSQGFSTYMDLRLRYFLELEVERQIIEGDGITELTGMLTSGFFTPLSGAQSDDTIIDLVHRAITQLDDNDYMASAIVMSPRVWESIALLKDGEERYLHGMPATGGPRTLWGLPVFTTASMPDDKFIVADLAMAAELQSREDAMVELGYENDDFTRNLVTMLGELRMALCILRPAAVIVGNA